RCSMSSAYTSVSTIRAMLRTRRQISRIEAERLIASRNTVSPLFIFGALAVGLFHRAEIGIIIVASHYAGNILVGFVMRFYGSEEEQTPNMSLIPSTKRNIIHSAFTYMHRTRLQI